MAAPVTQTGYRDGGKTSEAGIHRITRGLYTREGVILSGDLQVTQNGTPDTNVLIAVGDIVLGTTSPYTTFPPYFYHSWVATAGTLAIGANASGNTRLDAVVAYIDLSVVSSASNDNPGALKFMDVQGTPAGSPVSPTDAAIQTAVGASNPWVLLAVVTVANGFSSIVNANIADCRPLADTSSTADTDQSKAYVASGLVWAGTSGLSAANSAGRAYLNLSGGGGRAMYKPVITHLFTASKDTYVDLPPTAKATTNDDFTYTAVTNGAAAPALASGSIRLAKVVTSGAAVTSVVTSGTDSLGNQYMPRPIGTSQLELGSVALTTLSTQLQNKVNLGWLSLTGSFTYNANSGNKEFIINTPSDLSGQISAGDRFKCGRNVAPPTQCMSFTAASSQYATKASPTGTISTFTGPYTAEAWVYLNSYTGNTHMVVINRLDANFTTGGWVFEIFGATGQIAMQYGTGSNFTSFVSYQAVPLKKWTHIAVSVTSVSSKTGIVYMNGFAVPSTSSVSASTTLTQVSQDLRAGAMSATPANTYFDGFMSELRVWNVAQTQSAIQSNMAINLVGNETNLIGLWQGGGNFTDTTSAANTLTANGGAIATQAANPYNLTEQFIITAITTTTMTLFGGTDYNLPNATILASSANYSQEKGPYGFPAQRDKWVVSFLLGVAVNTSGTTPGTTYNPGGMNLSVPIGAWDLSAKLQCQFTNTAGLADQTLSISTNTSTHSNANLVQRNYVNTGGAGFHLWAAYFQDNINVAADTPYYMQIQGNSFSQADIRGDMVAGSQGGGTYINAVSSWA